MDLNIVIMTNAELRYYTMIPDELEKITKRLEFINNNIKDLDSTIFELTKALETLTSAVAKKG